MGPPRGHQAVDLVWRNGPDRSIRAAADALRAAEEVIPWFVTFALSAARADVQRPGPPASPRRMVVL